MGSSLKLNCHGNNTASFPDAKHLFSSGEGILLAFGVNYKDSANGRGPTRGGENDRDGNMLIVVHSIRVHKVFPAKI